MIWTSWDVAFVLNIGMKEKIVLQVLKELQSVFKNRNICL